MFQQERTVKQRRTDRKTQRTPRHIAPLRLCLDHAARKHRGWRRPRMAGLECQGKALGFPSRQWGAGEGRRRVAGHLLWFGEKSLAGRAGRERLEQEASQDVAQGSCWPGRGGGGVLEAQGSCWPGQGGGGVLGLGKQWGLQPAVPGCRQNASCRDSEPPRV